jgi:hypothetical protein
MPTISVVIDLLSLPKFGKPENGPFSAREKAQKTRKIFLTQVLTPQRLLTQHRDF